jgi:hypothetical protein
MKTAVNPSDTAKSRRPAESKLLVSQESSLARSKCLLSTPDQSRNKKNPILMTDSLFEMPQNIQTRCAGPENRDGAKDSAGQTNGGRKGLAALVLAVGGALLICGTASAATLPDGSTFSLWEDQTQYREIYHVAATHPRASDANPGTADEPWSTIGRAAELLQPGQKVVVHAGVYREQVVPRRSGNGPDSMIAYEAAPGEEVIVSGAEVWTPHCLPSVGWNTGKARIWMADLPGELFNGYNPFLARNIYEEVVSYSNPAEMSRYMLRRGAVFVNGLPLKQVYRFAELTSQDGAFWVEEPGLRLHFRLPGDADPTSASFEITVRAQVFAPRGYGLGYIRVSGFTFERAADSLPVPQRAMVSTHRGHHWIIENNRLRWANACGLDIGNQDWKAPKPAHPFGRHIIRRNHISDCGVSGIVGCKHVDETLIEGNLIERIGGLNVEGMFEVAGLKFHGAKRVLIRNNVFRDHTAANGIWLDYLNENCRITGNLFHNISTAFGAVFLEANREPNLVDHNVFVAIRKSEMSQPEYVSGSGVCADGANTLVAHNLFLDIEGFAVSMNDRTPGRNVGGSPIKPTGHRVLNNIFAACAQPVFLAGSAGNLSDGNLFDASTPDALFGIQNPAPGLKPGFVAWRKDFGQDAHSSQAPMEVVFDPATLTLRLACPAIRATSLAVPELGDVAENVYPGPLDPAEGSRLGEGKTTPNGLNYHIKFKSDF